MQFTQSFQHLPNNQLSLPFIDSLCKVVIFLFILAVNISRMKRKMLLIFFANCIFFTANALEDKVSFEIAATQYY
jgi:hypothetical protein